MPTVKCTRCGHLNPDTADRCERCYKNLDDEKASTRRTTKPKSTGTGIIYGKKAPPPKISSPLSKTGSGISIMPFGKGSTIGGPTSSSIKTKGITSSGGSPPTLLPLPSRMRRYGPPQLEGFVRDLREIQLDKPYSAKDFTGDAFLAMIMPKIAVVSVVSKLFHKDKQIAYAIQVEQASGYIQVGLLKGGELIPPEIGEYISAWGRVKKGILHVNALFNHKTGIEI